MTTNIKQKLGSGMSPQSFISGMTRNQDTFTDWYNRFSWPTSEDELFFAGAKSKDLRVAIIAADWCGDVARNVPVVLRVLEKAEIPTEMFIMEEHTDLIDQFLTFGGRSIPVVLFLNAKGNVLAKWGPRPAYVQEPMVELKTKYTDKEAPSYQDKVKETYAEIRRRYGEGTDYQAFIVKELRDIIQGL